MDFTITNEMELSFALAFISLLEEKQLLTIQESLDIKAELRKIYAEKISSNSLL
ncbi:MAG: hypothetical protein WC006_08185 [Bacilli bacterium]